MDNTSTEKMSRKNYCQHCAPYENSPRHLLEKIENISIIRLLSKPLNYIENRYFITFNKISNYLENSIFYLLSTSYILKEQKISINDNIPNRTMVILQEAENRGFAVANLTFFSLRSSIFSITIAKSKKYFNILPLNKRMFDFDNKYNFKKLLLQNNLPHPNGKLFTNSKRAISYVTNELNFPVVVKPLSGSLSKHTTVGITKKDELEQAIIISQILETDFIVEKFIPGNVYRIVIIGGKFIASCMREAPNIIGDGKHNITDLINIKNKDHRRGDKNQDNFTLHKIVVNDDTLALLDSRGYNLKMIPHLNQKIYLNQKITLASGADIVDVTDITHFDNKVMFEKIASLCGADLIGIDFICLDISKSWKEQECGVIEANSLPYIDMHHIPSFGTPRNVAGAMLDLLEKK